RESFGTFVPTFFTWIAIFARIQSVLISHRSQLVLDIFFGEFDWLRLAAFALSFWSFRWVIFFLFAVGNLHLFIFLTFLSSLCASSTLLARRPLLLRLR